MYKYHFINFFFAVVFLLSGIQPAQASYLPTVGSNIGIGTSTPVGAFTVLSGNVGIGTWSPTQSLQVVGTITAASFSGDGSGLNNLVATTGGGWTDGGAIMYQATTTDTVAIGTTTPSTTLEIVKQGSNAPLMISATATGDGNLLIVNPDGNIGIGTTAPVAGLSVMNGNVGIGTWSPIQKLQVIGTLNATYFVGDGSGLTGISAGGWVDGGTNVYVSPTTDNVGIGTTTPTAALLVENAGTQASFRVNDAVADGSPFVIMADGNIGVGTTVPEARFEIAGESTITYPAAGLTAGTIHITPSTGTDDNTSSLTFGANSGGSVIRTAHAGIYVQSSNVYGTRMHLATTDSYAAGAKVRMIIDEVGNIGLGTISPTVALLNVNGETYIAGPVGMGTFTPTGMLDVRIDEARIWTGAGTSTNATGAGELYVEGDLEVDGTIYGDGSGLTGISTGGWVDGGTNVYVSPTTDNIAIGTTTPASTLTLVGNIGIGTTTPYRTIPGPRNGIVVDGNIGIGTWTAVGGKLIVLGGGVGIGTVAPGSIFEISDPLAAGSRMFFERDTGGGSRIGMQDNGDNPWFIYQGKVTNAIGFYYNANSSPTIHLDSSGNVGIGLNNPAGAFIVDTGNVGIGTNMPVAGTAIMNGNVGIGTWNPSTKLQVVGTVTATTFVGDGSGLTGISAGGWVDGGTNVYVSPTTDKVGIGTTTPSSTLNIAGNIGIGTFSAYRLIAGPNNGMAIEGNVGIGTWNPLLKLQVIGTVSATSFVGDGSGLTGIAAGGWTDNGANIYVSTSTDNIGIGTWTSNLAKLTVIGGNVAIGTYSPDSFLTISNPQNTESFKIYSSTTALPIFKIDNSWSYGLFYLYDVAGTARVKMSSWYSAGAMIASDGSQTNLSDGFVNAYGAGLAISAPYVLNEENGITFGNGQVSDTQGAAITFYTTDTGAYGRGGLRFKTNNSGTVTTRMVIDETGNIGMGTITPINRLSMTGNIGIGTTLPYRRIAAPNNGMVVEGNVGIGTWNPLLKLQVVGTISATSFVGDGSGLTGISAGGWVDGGTNIYASPTTDNIAIGTTTPTAVLLVQNAGSQDSFRVNDAAVDGSPFIIFPDGNVGIGTTTPSDKLQVVGGDIRVDSTKSIYSSNVNGTNYIVPNNGNGVSFNIGAGGQFIINDGGGNVRASFGSTSTQGSYLINGNVGIGTTNLTSGLSVMNGNVGIGTWTPQAKLQVLGSVLATSFVGDGSGLTGISAGGWVDGGTNVYVSPTTDNVGIGTTTPVNRLSIQGNVGIGTTPPYKLIATTINGLAVEGNVGIGTWRADAQLEIAKLGNQRPLMVSSTGNANGDYLTVLSDGRVGIGTTSPGDKIEVVHTFDGNGLFTFANYNSSTSAVGGFQARSSSASGVFGATSSSYAISHLADRVFFGGGVDASGMTVYGAVAGQDIHFILGDPTIVSNIRMAIDPAGNVGIGTYSSNNKLNITGNVGIGTTLPYRRIGAPNNGMAIEGNVGIGTWNPSQKLHVVGNIRAQGGTDCTIGNGAGATNCSSDIRQKTNVRVIDSALPKILSLRGVEFDWNEKGQTPGRHDIGLIAQDVEKVFPTSVIEDKQTGFKMLDYAVLVAPIIQAMKELDAQFKALSQSVQETSRLKDIEVLRNDLEKKTKELSAIKEWICRKDPEAEFCNGL